MTESSAASWDLPFRALDLLCGHFIPVGSSSPLSARSNLPSGSSQHTVRSAGLQPRSALCSPNRPDLEKKASSCTASSPGFWQGKNRDLSASFAPTQGKDRSFLKVPACGDVSLGGLRCQCQIQLLGCNSFFLTGLLFVLHNAFTAFRTFCSAQGAVNLLGSCLHSWEGGTEPLGWISPRMVQSECSTL